MRKLFSVLSSTLQGGVRAVLLLLALFASVSAIYASNTKVDGIWYDFDSSTKTASVTYRGSSYSSYEGEYSGSVTIPETVTYNGTTYSVTSIEEFAFSGCYALTSITIPNSVTSIGDNAFDYCSSLPVENNLRYADTYLVEAVDKTLSTYSIKEGTKWIGDYAFDYCSALTSIAIPDSVTSIGWSAFSDCSALASVTIGNNVAIIDWYAFYNCSSLTSITIPNSVTSIKNQAFQGCSSLTSVTIGNNVTLIDNLAFFECSSLDTLRILATTPPTLRAEVFSRTPSPICYIPCGTKSAYEASDWAQYVSEFIEEGCIDPTWQITYTSTDGNIVTPNATDVFGANVVSNEYQDGQGVITFDGPVTSIGDYAFYYCSSLTSIVIPNSVTSIGYCAFSSCSSLNGIDIPNGVTRIGCNAFSYCTSLTFIKIPESVVLIENGDGFPSHNNIASGTPNLKSIIVDPNNPVYDSREGCNAVIETATNKLICGCQNTFIPNSVASIGYVAFYDCTTLTSIDIPSTVKSIKEGAFHNTGIDSVYIPAETIVEDWKSSMVEWFGAFSSCQNLTNITFAEGIKRIPAGVIAYCPNIRSVHIPSSVTSIGGQAFRQCTSLTSVTIPESVTSIGNCAFSGCSSLTTMVVEASNPTFDSRENCNAIIETATNTLIAGCQSTVIPNSVTSIGWSAFISCTSISSITIPESVTSIGGQAFFGCSSLTSITIPESVTSIGKSAFSRCSSLTSITIPNSVTSIGDDAFIDCTSLTSITCKATTPPTLGHSVFPSELTTAYIPCGTKEAYEASDWAQYVSEFVEDCYSNQKCGDNLFWKYNDTQLSITGHGDMYDYDIEPQPWMQYRSKMKTISLPDGMTSIGASAFANCKYVKSIAIPASVEKISDSAFEDCRMLSTITFAESSVLTHIGNWAFYNNHELTSITIPEGVIEIGYAAFYGCTYLDELTLPASMEYIADNGFALCAKLRRINVNASTPPVVEARTFEDVDRSIPVYVPKTSIELYKAAPVWQEFNIVGKNNTTTDVDNIHSPITNYHKLIRNGQLLILRESKTYNVMGQEVGD